MSKHDAVAILATQDHAVVQICSNGPRLEYLREDGGITLPIWHRDTWGIDLDGLNDTVTSIMDASELLGKVSVAIDYTAMPQLLAAAKAMHLAIVHHRAPAHDLDQPLRDLMAAIAAAEGRVVA